MPRFLACLILSLSLLIPTRLSAGSQKPQDLTLVSSITRLNDGQRDICTTWAIDSQMWITAAHCVLPEADDDEEEMLPPQKVFVIENTPADVVVADPHVDLAMLYTPEVLAIKPLKLKPSYAPVDSYAQAVGFPRMWSDIFDRPLSWDLRVKALFVETGCTAQYQQVFQGPALGGNSGSPVLQDGKVISVVQCQFGNGVSTGATWSDLVRFVVGHIHDTIPA